MTWTSNSKTLKSVKSKFSFKGGKKRAKTNSSTPVIPTANQDWHYALKNHSSIFKTGRAGSIRVARSGSQSRESSRAPRDRRSKTPVHLDAGTSKVASPAGSYPASPMSTSPAASTSVSRVQSMDDLHVEFQVQPMHKHQHHQQHAHQHPHHRHGHHQPRHPHAHHPHHNTHTMNYLRYLAMKREGTVPTTAAGSSGVVTPTESTAVSRTASVDGLSAMPSPGHPSTRHARHVDFADPRQQEQHAQQLIDAVTSIVKEREEKDKQQESYHHEKEESQWEDIEEVEEDLGESPSYLTFRRNSKTEGGEESV